MAIFPFSGNPSGCAAPDRKGTASCLNDWFAAKGKTRSDRGSVYFPAGPKLRLAEALRVGVDPATGIAGEGFLSVAFAPHPAPAIAARNAARPAVDRAARQ